MSHFNTIKLKITDTECLINALKTMFAKVEHHTDPVGLYGYEGNEREEKANVIVRREFIGSLSNDLGFIWNKETGSYDAVISDYDMSLLDGDLFIPNLSAFYTAFKAKQQGYLVGEPERQPNGTYRIPIQAPAKQSSKLTQSSSASSGTKAVSKFAQVKG